MEPGFCMRLSWSGPKTDACSGWLSRSITPNCDLPILMEGAVPALRKQGFDEGISGSRALLHVIYNNPLLPFKLALQMLPAQDCHDKALLSHIKIFPIVFYFIHNIRKYSRNQRDSIACSGLQFTALLHRGPEHHQGGF